MSQWPQISVIAWLVCCGCGGIGAALRPPARTIALRPRQQRLAAFLFTFAAATEATMLWCGGFFTGMF